MKIPHLAPSPKGSTHRVAGATLLLAIPRHHERGVINQKVVALGVAPAMILLGEGNHLIGLGYDVLKTGFVCGRETALLLRKGNDRYQRKVRKVFPTAQHRLGSRQIEAYRHAREERAKPARIEALDHLAKRLVRLTPIGAVACKGNGDISLEIHLSKGTVLARTLQLFPAY